eukprot:CAMPEP_0172587942 /NCGR_PEP_ID=MMETSP1068-20121228/6916_1 /TAXON_ID=35684 /ORGANISM="Pseudopedinella elastica, Strain CCMP716" /LENGTH=270 /DNA_ID=CAMNT_0013383121 /DNA_START=623 /DNA_END=1435 /DNA_ORIENTATION=-
MDLELSRTHSKNVLVWKIWFIEVLDFSSILIGAIKFAEEQRLRQIKENKVAACDDCGGGGATVRRLDLADDGAPTDDGWGHDSTGTDGKYYVWAQWDFMLKMYFAALVVNSFCFGGLSAQLMSTILTSRSRWCISDGIYFFVAAFVSVLDAVTDLPIWVASLITRAYVGNPFLTFNIVLNLLACIRGVYITLSACIDDRDESDGEDESIIKVWENLEVEEAHEKDEEDDQPGETKKSALGGNKDDEHNGRAGELQNGNRSYGATSSAFMA